MKTSEPAQIIERLERQVLIMAETHRLDRIEIEKYKSICGEVCTPIPKKALDAVTFMDKYGVPVDASFKTWQDGFNKDAGCNDNGEYLG